MKQVPDGFVLLASYDTRKIGDHRRGPTGDYARLLREVERDKSSITAYKDSGQWVVRKSDIDEFIRVQSEKSIGVVAKKPTRTPAAAAADDATRDLLSSIESTLHDVSKASHRMAAAVEALTWALRTNAAAPERTTVLSASGMTQQDQADVEE